MAVYYRVECTGRPPIINPFSIFRSEDVWVGMVVHELPVIRLTPKGAWVEGLDYQPRWISNEWNKRYATPTKEGAILSFKKRKERQIMLLKAQLSRAEYHLKLHEQGRFAGQGITPITL